MIITVTLNAAIDRTLAVPNFRLGRRHRAVEQTAMAGGKGVNVARVLKALGQPVIATGVAGGATGTRIIEQLTSEAILNDFVRIREESRTSTAVVDPTSGEQTEINERGPAVSEAELELFYDKLLYLAKGAGVVVFSGSLPRGVPDDLYARLVQDVKELGATTVLDSEGEALRLATRAEPTVVTPNETDVVEPVSTVGSGDAFLAGYVAARYGGGRPADCLRFAVACGAESVRHMGAGMIEAREAERLVDEVSVETLAEPA